MLGVVKTILRCGPFTAGSDDGRRFFEDAVVEVYESHLTLLEGPSGSGKSTLLRQVAGLAAAPDAERSLCGQEYATRDLPVWRSVVTLLAQGAPVLPGTVEENLGFPFQLRHSGERFFDEGQARDTLDAVGLDAIALDREASSLSGGERHRLCLVRGLLWDPQVLLADEPLAGLDEDAAVR